MIINEVKGVGGRGGRKREERVDVNQRNQTFTSALSLHTPIHPTPPPTPTDCLLLSLPLPLISSLRPCFSDFTQRDLPKVASPPKPFTAGESSSLPSILPSSTTICLSISAPGCHPCLSLMLGPIIRCWDLPSFPGLIPILVTLIFVVEMRSALHSPLPGPITLSSLAITASAPPLHRAGRLRISQNSISTAQAPLSACTMSVLRRLRAVHNQQQAPSDPFSVFLRPYPSVSIPLDFRYTC